MNLKKPGHMEKIKKGIVCLKNYKPRALRALKKTSRNL